MSIDVWINTNNGVMAEDDPDMPSDLYWDVEVALTSQHIEAETVIFVCPNAEAANQLKAAIALYATEVDIG